MTLLLVGLSHRVAPIELRERVALPGPQAGELAHALAGESEEAVCLSTCNRTELYLVSEEADDAELKAVEALSAVAHLEAEKLRPTLYRLRDEAAALHLCRVAAGLDSMVPGEGEILGQVRGAYEAGATGPILDRLFHQALHAGKKVRADTAIAEAPASVSSAAAALAEQVFGDLHGCRVLLIGAGKIGELAARSLVARGAEITFVANRSLDRAEDLAERMGAAALPLIRIPEQLEHADVVLSSTSAPGFVLGRADVEAVLPKRKGRPLFLIDIAVPRDLDPEIDGLDGCYLYDIDDLQTVVEESLASRRREAGAAEAIVAAEADRFREWQASREVVPAIASLRAHAEEIRAAELERARGLSERERRAVESVTARVLDKLLHLPTVRLKEAAAGADGAVYADAVRHLFGLGDDAASGRHPRQ
jgi:glutamyl-tRNA reductase